MLFTKKVCLVVFLAAIFSGRTNELGVLTGSIAGAILLWPLYRKYTSTAVPKRKAPGERAPAEDPITAIGK